MISSPKRPYLQRKHFAAFDELYTKYSGAVYGILITICTDEKAASVMLRQIFVEVFNDNAAQSQNSSVQFPQLLRKLVSVVLSNGYLLKDIKAAILPKPIYSMAILTTSVSVYQLANG